MPRLCCMLVSMLIASSASAVSMAWTPIENRENDNISNPSPGTFTCGSTVNQPCGDVEYSYYIGTYEVTNAQYAEFLNAKAASDLLLLYYPCMGSADYGGITRSGTPGSYTYATIVERENMPVNYVTFYDALRFANWMNNGQGSGDTETGAYTLLGNRPTPTNGDFVTRNAGASILLPNDDEWHKAAYYDAATLSYFTYPTGTNTQVVCSTPNAAPNQANCGGAIPLTSTGSAAPTSTAQVSTRISSVA